MNNLNRTERRKLTERAKKKAEFAKRLTPLQQEYIEEIVLATKEHTQMEMIVHLDTVISGALIEKTHLNLDGIFDINVTVGKFMGEIKNIEKSICLEERAMNLRKIEREVSEKIFNMITSGMERKDIVKAVREEYKGSGITTAEINVAYKRSKEKNDEMINSAGDIKQVLGECDSETKDALEYIFADDKETQNKTNVEEKEVGQTNTPKTEEKSITSEKKKGKRVSKLKVIKEVTKVVSRDIQGDYGTYHIEGNVVNIDDEYAFTNLSEVKNWASETRKELAEKLEKIKTEIRYINMCEAEALEVIETYM